MLDTYQCRSQPISSGMVNPIFRWHISWCYELVKTNYEATTDENGIKLARHARQVGERNDIIWPILR